MFNIEKKNEKKKKKKKTIFLKKKKKNKKKKKKKQPLLRTKFVQKVKIVNFKIHDVTTWLTNNYNAHVAQYLTK